MESNKQTVKITLEYLRQQFVRFNEQCFGGSLIMPELKVTNARTMLGNVRYKKERHLFRKPSFHDFTLSISAYYELSASEAEDIILHEMIHLDILSHQQHDTSAHGKLFRTKMQEINRRFGRHITISHRGRLEQTEQKVKQNIIGISEFQDGSWGLTRVSPSKAREIQRALPRYYKLRTTEWYNTKNPYFNTFPRSLTPKIYRINIQEVRKELEDAIRLDW